MGDGTTIEWTRGADGAPGATWNPVRGCDPISPGCANCYAKRFAERFRGVPGHPFEQGFDVRLVPEALELPLRWKRPRRVFVNSMSDLFHEDVPNHFIWRVFEVMAAAPQHTFLVLTKRPARAAALLPELHAAGVHRSGVHRPGFGSAHLERPWPLPNVWLGVSVENQDAANERIPELLRTPAAVRFLSCEPLLGPVDLDDITVPEAHGEWHFSALAPDVGPEDDEAFRGAHVDWVIAGGESGPGARPMHPAWARGLRDQCATAGVPFFFKQWGEWEPFVDDERFTRGDRETERNAQHWLRDDGERGVCWIYDDDGTWQNHAGDPGDDMSRVAIVNRWGKKRAGRLLDGVTHDAMPEVPRD